VLDGTIFYPQGGGQPSDTGIIAFESGRIELSDVRYYSGEARHYFVGADSFPAQGDQIKMQIDLSGRILNSRYHTAGHLLVYIVEEIASEDRVVAVKGYQFPQGAYVEFNNTTKRPIASDIELINRKLSGAIKEDLDVVSRETTFEEIQKIHPHLAPFVPKDKPSRSVQIGNYPSLPCGGTHVPCLSEIGMAIATKVKNRKEHTKISYNLGM